MGLQLDTCIFELFLLTLTVFRIAGKNSLGNDKWKIVARWFDIWSWIRCKTLVGIPLGQQDLLRDDFFLYISSLFVEVIIKKSLNSDDTKFLNDLFENLIFENLIWKFDISNTGKKVI